MEVCESERSYEIWTGLMGKELISSELDVKVGIEFVFRAYMNCLNESDCNGVSLQITIGHVDGDCICTIEFDDMFFGDRHAWLSGYGISLGNLLTADDPKWYINQCITSVLSKNLKLEILRYHYDEVEFELNIFGFLSQARLPISEARRIFDLLE